jgi:hypothetical protein
VIPASKRARIVVLLKRKLLTITSSSSIVNI